MDLDKLPIFIFLLIILIGVDIGCIVDNQILYNRIKLSENVQGKDLRRIKYAKCVYSVLSFINIIAYVIVCCVVQSSLKYISFFVGLTYSIVLFFCMNKTAHNISKTIEAYNAK